MKDIFGPIIGILGGSALAYFAWQIIDAVSKQH